MHTADGRLAGSIHHVPTATTGVVTRLLLAAPADVPDAGRQMVPGNQNTEHASMG